MKSRVRKPEKRWTLVNQQLWKINNQIRSQRHSSGTRSAVGSDVRETKRVRFTEFRGQERQGEDVEELAAKAEEQHLDADVEVPAQKTWRVEDVVGDAADAAPEQMNILLDAREQPMNSLVQSKTEMFEKIEESLRPL